MKMQTFLIIILATFGTLLAYGQETKVKPEHLTAETFKEKVFDYDKNSEEWVFEGERPCVIDFYADWCKPCKLIAPIMEELAQEYAGKVDIYKVNTDQQKELSALFGIRSIPSVLYCPMEGRPQMSTGALAKETFRDVIDEFLLGISKENKDE